MKVKNSLIVFFIIVFISCGNENFSDERELVAYIEDTDNEYSHSNTVNNIFYKLLYKPTDLIVKQDVGDDFNSDKIKLMREKYSKFMYFNLSLSFKNEELLNSVAKDKEKFSKVLNDLTFGMENKVYLLSKGNDTLRMIDFIYPRMYGMSNETTVLLVFPRDSTFLKQDYLNFIIKDFGLETGDIKFKLNTKAVINEPQLRFN